MNRIYKAILLIFFAFTSVNAQSSGLIMLFSGGAEFDPLTFDANTVLLYDGDLELSTATWGNQASGSHDITFDNTPTVISGAINGHDAIRFDGATEDGRTTTPAISQPYTIYIVFKQITWGSILQVLDDGVVNNAGDLLQLTASPNLRMYAGESLSSDPDLALNTYGIMSLVFNGASSEIRTNTSAAVTGNAGTSDRDGIALGARADGAQEGNCEIAYLIVRSGADDTATQDLFIAFLQDRFAL